MRAELKEILCEGVLELEEYIPEEYDNFCISCTMSIGTYKGEGEELFNAIICTPKWLIENYSEDEVLFLRHYIIVFDYNHKRITQAIEKKVNSTFGKDWNEIAEKLSRIGYWEFEDYIGDIND